jgi:hypothetical protein
MTFSYLIPSISALYPGHSCYVAGNLRGVGERLLNGTGLVVQKIDIYAEGESIFSNQIKHRFENGNLLGDSPSPFYWPAQSDQWPGGYLENGFYTQDEAPLFSNKIPPSFYAIYSRAGNKSFFSDNTLKYSSPSVIAQIASYGKFVDGYPVVRIDRARNYGETLVLINPYQRPVIADVYSDTAGEIRRIRIEPNSTVHVRLDRLLKDSEAAWSGQIQIGATNRVITYIVKHSLADPLFITDHEHLDPYRGEPTHLPAFSWFRLHLGFWLKNRPLKKRL